MSNAAMSDERTWEYLKEGQTVLFAVPETDNVTARLTCIGEGKSRLQMLYAEKPEQRFRDGQSIALKVTKAGSTLSVEGKLEKYVFGDEFLGWDFVADVPVNHSIFEFMKVGGTLQIAAEPGYTVPLAGAQQPVEEWQLACAREANGSKPIRPSSVTPQDKVPQFRDFPVRSISQGKNATPILDDARKRNYRTRIRETRDEKTNLAGRYVLTVWGCGSGCLTGAVVDASNGNVTMLPFALATAFVGDEEAIGPDFYHRPNSALIVFGGKFEPEDGIWNDPSGGMGGYHYFVFQDGRFRYLKTSLTNIE
jgi:hypothetical protein